MAPIRWIVVVAALLSPVVTAHCAVEAELKGSAVTPALRTRGIAVLRQALSDPEPWVRVHAGENLVALDYPQQVRAAFESEFAANGHIPQYRIGVFRVLARVSYRPEHRSQWIERITAAFLDEDGPDRVHAAETLAKLGCTAPVKSELEAALLRATQGEPDALAVYAQWMLANGNPSHRRQLVQLLMSDDPDVRLRAAYALRHQTFSSPADQHDMWALLQQAADREPPGDGRVYLVSAAFRHAPADQAQIYRRALYEYLDAGSKDERYEAVNVLAVAGDHRDLPLLVAMLDDPEMDVRQTAANAILRIGRRIEHHLSPVDWTVIACYALGMLAVGFYYARRTATSDDYMLGGRTMRPWAVGLSLLATLLSTISYLASPGEIIKNGPMILASIAGYPLVIFIVGWLLVPYFMRLRVTSAYEIMELRFGLSIRLLGSCMFLSLRMLWMAVIIYATTTKMLIPLAGLDESWAPWVCAIMGAITIVYTSMGGLRAVVWTDVVQTFILFGGAILAIVMVTVALGGVTQWWPIAWPENWQEPMWGFQTDGRVTFGWMVVSMVTWWVCTSGSDQMAVQRYLSTRDVKAARRVVFVSLLADLMIACILAILGLALLGYFHANPHMVPDGKTIYDNADQLFPHYIAVALPVGITGLIVAAILAAAMSSLSSGVNSACSVITVDFVSRFRKQKLLDADYILVARAISMFVGTLVVLATFWVSTVTGNLLEVSYKVTGLFVAPLFVMFFLAMFIPWATLFGAWMAEICSIATAACIAYWHELTGQPGPSFLFIMPMSLLVGVVIGMLASIVPVGPGPRVRISDLVATTLDDAVAATKRQAP